MRHVMVTLCVLVATFSASSLVEYWPVIEAVD